MTKKSNSLDEEWVNLILQAKKQGLSKTEILSYIKKNQIKETTC